MTADKKLTELLRRIPIDARPFVVAFARQIARLSPAPRKKRRIRHR